MLTPVAGDKSIIRASTVLAGNISAADGKLFGEISLPARVSECGLAVAGNRRFASCEGGTIVCLGAR